MLRVAAAPDHPELDAALTGLPVAGFTGSLAYRFDGRARRPAAGGCGPRPAPSPASHGWPASVTDLDGTVMVFAAHADRVRLRNTLDARDALDDAAAALAACRCSASVRRDGSRRCHARVGSRHELA